MYTCGVLDSWRALAAFVFSKRVLAAFVVPVGMLCNMLDAIDWMSGKHKSE